MEAAVEHNKPLSPSQVRAQSLIGMDIQVGGHLYTVSRLNKKKDGGFIVCESVVPNNENTPREIYLHVNQTEFVKVVPPVTIFLSFHFVCCFSQTMTGKRLYDNMSLFETFQESQLQKLEDLETIGMELGEFEMFLEVSYSFSPLFQPYCVRYASRRHAFNLSTVYCLFYKGPIGRICEF